MKLLFSLQQFVTKKNTQLLALTLLYYVSLVVVNANLWLLVVTTLYTLGVFWLTKQWWLTFWFLLLVTLPLAKGKALVFTIIPKADLVERHAVFDLNYILSFYVADIFLLMSYWMILRQPFAKLRKIGPALQKLRWLGWSFLVFLAIAIWPHRDSNLFEIVWLSGLQLIKAVSLFLLPTLLSTQFMPQKKTHSAFSEPFIHLTQFALLGSLFFQTVISLLQFLNGGPLGLYFEAILPLGNDGQPAAISTMENADILRTTGSFFDPSLLGTVMFSLLLWLWYQRPTIQPLWLKWLGLAAASLTIIFTSNRLLMLTLLLWWSYQAANFFRTMDLAQITNWLKKSGWWFVGLGFGLAILIAPYAWNRFTSLQSLFSQFGSGTYRIELALYSVRLAIGQPWGVGLNLSPYYLATEFNQETVSFDPAPPHNLLFQLLAETGFFGLAIAVWLIYLIYRPISQSKAQPFIKLTGFGVAGLAFLYCAQFYPVFLNQIETFSWLMLFLGLYWVEKPQLVHDKT